MKNTVKNVLLAVFVLLILTALCACSKQSFSGKRSSSKDREWVMSLEGKTFRAKKYLRNDGRSNDISDEVAEEIAFFEGGRGEVRMPIDGGLYVRPITWSVSGKALSITTEWGQYDGQISGNRIEINDEDGKYVYYQTNNSSD